MYQRSRKVLNHAPIPHEICKVPPINQIFASMNLDVIYEVLSYIKLLPPRERNEILACLGQTCSEFNTAVRRLLFREVRWPHYRLSKLEVGIQGQDAESLPLPFLPEATWGLIHEFHFDWPEDWPDVLTNPSFSDHPSIFDLLDASLPRLSNLHTFTFTLPFDPPPRTLTILLRDTPLRELRVVDTPLTMMPLLPIPVRVESLSLVPVAEGLRIGEGPFNRKLREMHYFTRPYRREHRTKRNWVAGEAFIRHFAHTRIPIQARAYTHSHLRYLHISLQYVWSLQSLASASDCWPELETLVLTGSCGAKRLGGMVDVVHTMPKLRDLRLLLAKNIGHDHADTGDDWSMNHYHHDPRVEFARLTSLALSNTYETELFLVNASQVEDLCISAILRHPQIPIGMKAAEVEKAMKDLESGGGNRTLKRLRLMVEDEISLSVGFCDMLGRVCEKLERLEVERCGYTRGEVGFEWTDYGEVFSMYRHLRDLRIGIPFADCDEDCDVHPENKECIRSDRQDLALYLASCVPTLRYVGFEYRTRTGKYSKEDRWLDYEIVRSRTGDDIKLVGLEPSWYELPEIWNRSFLFD